MRRYAIIVLGLIVALIVAACASPAPAPTQSSAPASGQAQAPAAQPQAPAGKAVAPAAPAAPTKDTLVIGQTLDPPALDVESTTAGYQNVFGQIMEQLIVFASDKVTIQPMLATEWKWVDNVTLEMKLRQNVKFSNGEPFDAEAAKFSVEKQFNARSYSIWLKDLLKEVVVKDPSTIQIVLKKPAAFVLPAMARGSFVVPPKDFKARGKDAFDQKPIGTGPWVLSEWIKDDRIVMNANPTYWGGQPKFKQLIFRTIPEDAARVAALEAGELDIAVSIPVSAAERIKNNQKLKLHVSDGIRIMGLVFDTRVKGSEVLKDKRVRQALNYAVDKEAICKNLFGGYCRPLPGQWLTSAFFGYNPDVKAYPYDPAKAKQLLADAGFPNGFEMTMAWTVGRYPQDKQAGEAVAGYLKAVGVKVTEKVLEYAEFQRQGDALTRGNAYLAGYLTPPDAYLTLVIFQPGSTLYRHWDFDPKFDALIANSASEQDDKKRQAMFQEGMKIINDDPFAIYLYTTSDIYATSQFAASFVPRVDQVLWLHDMALSK